MNFAKSVQVSQTNAADLTHVFFISIVFFNLRLEYALVFHKSSLKICLKYAYIKTFIGQNVMI